MKAPLRFRGPAHTARSLALQALLDSRRHDAFVQEILDRLLGAHPLPAADRRLATQLAYGVLRRRGTLNALVRPFVHRPAWKTEPWLADALALGAYQLALLTHIPAHAALHETVELAALYGRPSAKGFLNGVLRRLSELMTDEYTDAPAADALPLEQGQYRRLRQPVLPDPRAHPLEYLSGAFALPSWLADRWRQRYGEDECRRLGFWVAGAAPLTLRCNPLRCSRDELRRTLAQAQVEAEPGEHPQAVRLRDAAAIRDLPGYLEGWFSVQDESAMRVASALAPQAGEAILDLCAAPGGKATHLAELMGDRGRVVACDADPRRLEVVSGLARRLGLTIIETHIIEKEGQPPAGVFDRALVDVPCSNTGVLGRRPEARWRLRPEDLGRLVPLQRRLLRQAAEGVRPGGVVVYSTCSMEPEENRAVVQQFLKEAPQWGLDAEEESVPGRPADGGYWARLRRREQGDT
jgi:16S rRNA (cytosine967-C5)-methyltransferase